MRSLTPFLWYDTQAEEAARFYIAVFGEADAAIVATSRYGPGGPGPVGSVMTVTFMIQCDTQAQVDQLWERLGEGGEPGPCGWLKDRDGLSWQVTPAALLTMLSDPDPERANRVMSAMLQMSKIELPALEAARRG